MASATSSSSSASSSIEPFSFFVGTEGVSSSSSPRVSTSSGYTPWNFPSILPGVSSMLADVGRPLTSRPPISATVGFSTSPSARKISTTVEGLLGKLSEIVKHDQVIKDSNLSAFLSAKIEKLVVQEPHNLLSSKDEELDYWIQQLVDSSGRFDDSVKKRFSHHFSYEISTQKISNSKESKGEAVPASDLEEDKKERTESKKSPSKASRSSSANVTRVSKYGSAVSQNNRAYLLYCSVKKKDALSEAALKILKDDARDGHAFAQYYLGDMYKFGYGVTKDYNESEEWYQLSLDGHSEYWELKELDDNKCYIKANFYLGWMLETQKPNEIRFLNARYYYSKAAQLGDVSAQYNCGLLCERAKGRIPISEAIKWLRMAAEQGHPKASYNLGLIYAKGGSGVTISTSNAKKWLLMAANQGHEKAKLYLAKFYFMES